MAVSSLPRDWIAAPFLRLLFQNLVAEEREDIRDATLATWRIALGIMASIPRLMEEVVTQQLLYEWYAIAMTPLGIAIDPSSFYHPSASHDGNDAAPERHNVDKNMLAQDLSLISIEITLKARVAAATALAFVMVCWPHCELSIEDIFQPILSHYIDSTSMLQKFLAAVVAEEWATQYDAAAREGSPPLIDHSPLAKELSAKTLAWLQAPPPTAYHEMALTLVSIHKDCYSLLQSFLLDCKVPASSIPRLGSEIDITGTQPGSFTIDTAQAVVGSMFAKLKESLGRTKKKELSVISEKRSKVVASIDRYIEVKAQHDTRVSAAFAAAFVAFKSTPDKVSPVVKGIMNGVKVGICLIRLDHGSDPQIRMKRTSIFKAAPLLQSPRSSNFAPNITSPSRRIKSSRISALSSARMSNRPRRSHTLAKLCTPFYLSK